MTRNYAYDYACIVIACSDIRDTKHGSEQVNVHTDTMTVTRYVSPFFFLLLDFRASAVPCCFMCSFLGPACTTSCKTIVDFFNDLHFVVLHFVRVEIIPPLYYA